MIELVKKSTSGVEVVNAIMKFWAGRESTGTVLAMKYVDLGCCTVAHVVEWLLQQDGWTDRAWGWELVSVCVDKIDSLASQGQQNGENTNGEGEERMEVDSSANGVAKEGRREILGKIVEGVPRVYERAVDEFGREWVTEWFRMIVGTYYEEFAGFEAEGWAGDILRQADDFRKLLA
jgi:MIF4G like